MTARMAVDDFSSSRSNLIRATLRRQAIHRGLSGQARTGLAISLYGPLPTVRQLPNRICRKHPIRQSDKTKMSGFNYGGRSACRLNFLVVFLT
jgi:hypothetical protein